MTGAEGRQPPVLVGIGGCSGSGKTTLAATLANRLGATHFHLDSYYRDLGHLALRERMQQNFDDPAMIESPLLAAQIASLAQGQSIERPLYDFSTHSRIHGQTDRPPRRLFAGRGPLRALLPRTASYLPIARLCRYTGRCVLRAAPEARCRGTRPHAGVCAAAI